MPYLVVLAIMGGILFPRIVVRYLMSREDEAYSERFAAALNQMSASLNAGLSFGQAVDDVITSDLVHKQVRDDFRRLSASIKMGIPIIDSFFEYARRTGNEDVYDVAVAVSIMLETGKDEGAGIKQIQKNIEDRMMYRKNERPPWRSQRPWSMGMVRSRMEYVAYAACRAAVVSTKDKAQEQAEMVARENTKAVGGAKLSLVDVTVERVDPVTGKAASSKKKGKKSSRKASGSDTDWGKGVYVRCTVTCDVKTFTLFTSGRKSSAIVMMVEQGSENLFDISDFVT